MNMSSEKVPLPDPIKLAEDSKTIRQNKTMLYVNSNCMQTSLDMAIEDGVGGFFVDSSILGDYEEAIRNLAKMQGYIIAVKSEALKGLPCYQEFNQIPLHEHNWEEIKRYVSQMLKGLKENGVIIHMMQFPFYHWMQNGDLPVAFCFAVCEAMWENDVVPITDYGNLFESCCTRYPGQKLAANMCGSVEFYTSVRDRLNPNAVLMQGMMPLSNIPHNIRNNQQVVSAVRAGVDCCIVDNPVLLSSFVPGYIHTRYKHMQITHQYQKYASAKEEIYVPILDKCEPEQVGSCRLHQLFAE